MYKMNYDSPIGNIVLKSDGYFLVECYFSDEKENEGKREEEEIGTKEKEFMFSAFVRTQKG